MADSIDALLEEETRRIKEKRARLKHFETVVKELRALSERAQEQAENLLKEGDLTRSEIGQVYGLSRAERALLVPARSASKRGAPHELGQGEDATAHEGEQFHDQA